MRIFLHCLPAFHDLKTEDRAKKCMSVSALSDMEVTDEVFESSSPGCLTKQKTGCTPLKAVMAATLGAV